jgi:ABC-type glycerol-3-phosphate transport system substrate-binding protein
MSGTPSTKDLLDAYGYGRLTRRDFVRDALKLGVSVSGAAALLSACQRGTHQSAPTKLAGRVQILVGFDGGNTAPQRQVQQALAQAFIAAHPRVGIDFLRATSAAAAETQLAALIARGSAPDIVLGIGLGEVSRLVDRHLWLDLQGLIHRDGVATSAFQSQAAAAAALPSYYGRTKAVPGLPLGFHDHALAYNADLFSQAGVQPPPVSWSDNSWLLTGSFLQAAQALTVDSDGKHAGQAGFDISKVTRFGAARFRPEASLFSFGGHLYDPAKRQAILDAPAAVAGAQFAADLVNRYHVHPNAAQVAQLAPGAAPGSEELAAWRAGKLAMIDLCSCELDSPFASQVPFAWRAAPLPAGPARRFNFLEVSLGTIVAASAHHDLAWEVLKFFAVEPARERELSYGGFGVMAGLTANGDAFPLGIKQAVGVDPAVWVAGLPGASAENDAWLPAFADVHDLMSAAFGQIVGGANPATVMPQLQQQAQAKIDAWFKANQLPR